MGKLGEEKATTFLCAFSYFVSFYSARQTIFDLVGLKYECIIDYLSLDQINRG